MRSYLASIVLVAIVTISLLCICLYIRMFIPLYAQTIKYYPQSWSAPSFEVFPLLWKKFVKNYNNIYQSFILKLNNNMKCAYNTTISKPNNWTLQYSSRCTKDAWVLILDTHIVVYLNVQFLFRGKYCKKTLIGVFLKGATVYWVSYLKSV